jgi:hypothetical protein
LPKSFSTGRSASGNTAPPVCGITELLALTQAVARRRKSLTDIEFIITSKKCR